MSHFSRWSDVQLRRSAATFSEIVKGFGMLPNKFLHEWVLRQSIRTRGAFVTPWQKLRALPSYIEILTVPMALRVIRIAETLSASAETRGIDLTRRKSNYLSLRFSAWDVVFCVLLAASIAAGLIL